jgi:outer membrane protein assembly factor BamB
VDWACLCSSPVVEDGKLLLYSSRDGHAVGVERFSLEGGKSDWINKKVSSTTSQCILMNDHIYGLSSPRFLFCLDWKTGKEIWRKGNYSVTSNLIAADSKLIVQDGKGDLVIVDAATGKEISRSKGVVGETYTPPTLAEGRIYCRDSDGKIVCLCGKKQQFQNRADAVTRRCLREIAPW